jgi:putative ABC transport system permease protein
MGFGFTFLVGPAVLAALLALGLTLLLGLAGTFTALGQKPAPVLRNL